MCNVLRLELWFLWKLAVLWRTELRSKALDHLWSTAFVQFIIYELMIDFVNDLRSRLERVSWASFEADRELWFIACNHLWWSVHGGLDFPVTVRNLITDLSIMLLGDSLTKNMNAVNALKTLQGCCSRKIINDATVWWSVMIQLINEWCHHFSSLEFHTTIIHSFSSLNKNTFLHHLFYTNAVSFLLPRWQPTWHPWTGHHLKDHQPHSP